MTQTTFAKAIVLIEAETAMLNQAIAAATKFDYDATTGTWRNVAGLPTDETDVGFVAFYHNVSKLELTSAEMIAGWEDAFGQECYNFEMLQDEIDAQVNGWMN